MIKQAELSRTDAICYAVKKVLEKQRTFIDEHDVRSVQITVSINVDGKANVMVSHRTEDVVVGCYEGFSRHERFIFST